LSYIWFGIFFNIAATTRKSPLNDLNRVSTQASTENCSSGTSGRGRSVAADFRAKDRILLFSRQTENDLNKRSKSEPQYRAYLQTITHTVGEKQQIYANEIVTLKSTADFSYTQSLVVVLEDLRGDFGAADKNGFILYVLTKYYNYCHIYLLYIYLFVENVQDTLCEINTNLQHNDDVSKLL